MKWNFIKASVLYLATVVVVAGNASEAKAVGCNSNLIAEVNQSITSIESMTHFLENRTAFSMLNNFYIAQNIVESVVTSEDGESVKIAKSSGFEEKQEISSYKDMLKHVAVVSCADRVNVRSSATVEDEENIIGKAYNNAVVSIEDVVQAEDGVWYFVTSGNVEGYIRGDNLITGKEARSIVESMNEEGVVEAETLRLRAEASLEGEVVGTLQKGESCIIDEHAENGFAKVTTALGKVGYVAEEYLSIEADFETALTLEEYEQKLEEEVQAQAAQQAYIEAEGIKYLMDEAYANYLDQLNAEWFRNAQAFAEEYKSHAEELIVIGEYYGFEDIVAYGQGAITNAKSYIATAQSKIAEVEDELAAQAEAAAKAQIEAAAREQASATTNSSTSSIKKPSTTTTTSSGSTSNVSSIRQAIVAEALKWPGKCSYVWGGTNLTVGGGVDCSGFTLSVYKKVAGMTLNRTSSAQSTMGRRIALSEVQPGDLVFYYNGSSIGHVAIYIGNGQIVHAKNPSAGIGVDSMYYTQPAWAITLF